MPHPTRSVNPQAPWRPVLAFVVTADEVLAIDQNFSLYQR